MKLQQSIIPLTTLLLSPMVAVADTDALMQDCNGCHGDNGVSQWTDMPTIAGVPEFVLSDALYIYRDGDRPCAESEYRQGDTGRPATDMCRVAAELSDEQIDAIAAAYAEMPFVPAKQEFDADLAAQGESLHDAQCDRCHSDAGTNPDDEAGILGGQWMGYLDAAFAQYQAGERDQPKKMEENIAKLSDDDVKALVNFYGAQQ